MLTRKENHSANSKARKRLNGDGASSGPIPRLERDCVEVWLLQDLCHLPVSALSMCILLPWPASQERDSSDTGVTGSF